MHTRLRLPRLLIALSLLAAVAFVHAPALGQGKGSGKGKGSGSWGKGGREVLKQTGNNHKKMAGAAVKKLPGMATTCAIEFLGVETREGAPWLSAKGDDGKRFEAPLLTASPTMYDATGAPQKLDKIAQGDHIDAILFPVRDDIYVVGFRDPSVVVKQHEMRLTSADTMQERVTMTDKIAGTISVPIEGALVIDALGAPKRFSDIKTGSTVEAIWKDKPGNPTLLLLRI